MGGEDVTGWLVLIIPAGVAIAIVGAIVAVLRARREHGQDDS